MGQVSTSIATHTTSLSHGATLEKALMKGGVPTLPHTGDTVARLCHANRGERVGIQLASMVFPVREERTMKMPLQLAAGATALGKPTTTPVAMAQATTKSKQSTRGNGATIC